MNKKVILSLSVVHDIYAEPKDEHSNILMCMCIFQESVNGYKTRVGCNRNSKLKKSVKDS
ncbi:CLUMA_CG006009, isoform A [Clunio marinus]|uniref:CLUMA_CG006009, isoform A n=1 Tax=Clunio marinus TaxID=568069 RepID=A0A1J1HY09_9DIPT|nr:CLUMA_CG006009, isoform A [Clunio marinus]